MIKRQFDSQCPSCFETRQRYIDARSGKLNFILPMVCLHKGQCKKQMSAELRGGDEVQLSVPKAGQRWTDRLHRKQMR